MDSPTHRLSDDPDSPTIDQFIEFCVSQFSYKSPAPPQSYFYKHFHSDPHRIQSKKTTDNGQGSVFVKLGDFDQIVSSVRVFSRQMHWNNKVITMCGIGEVATASSHRRKGLSKSLLRDAIEVMFLPIVEDEVSWVSGFGADLSLLHAAVAFRPFYQSLGYQSTPPIPYVTVNISLPPIPPIPAKNEIPISTISTDTSKLPQTLAKSMAATHNRANLNLTGTVIRNADYFQTWFLADAERFVDGQGGGLRYLSDEAVVSAWVVLKHASPNQWEVRDFGFNDASEITSELLAFQHLVSGILKDGDNVKMLQKLADILLPSGYETAATVEYDDGWMYYLKDGSKIDDEEVVSMTFHAADGF